MKYRNPETGQFEELYFKATDTLPIGTEVDYTGTDIPWGWEEVSDPDPSEIIRIRKTDQQVGVVGNVVNDPSGSTKDTYSCNYLNTAFASISELEWGSNINNLKEPGFHLYRTRNATGTLPSGYSSDNDFFVESYIISVTADWGRQILLDIRANRMFIRALRQGNWGDWAEVNTNIKISSGTANPSGGNDGDIYFKYS